MGQENSGNQQGYICPSCKGDDRLSIAALLWVKLLPDGTDNDDSDTEWDDHHAARCACGWFGIVADLEQVAEAQS